jgi:hypothetical protein
VGGGVRGRKRVLVKERDSKGDEKKRV